MSLGNLLGALFMAYFLGHYVGLSEGAAAAKTIAIAEAKVQMDFGRAFVSAIACNWMACMGIWFYFGAKQTSGRILAIWFPVMIFCAYRITTLCRQYVYYSCWDFCWC